MKNKESLINTLLEVYDNLEVSFSLSSDFYYKLQLKDEMETTEKRLNELGFFFKE